MEKELTTQQKHEMISRKFMERHNLKFTNENFKAIEDTALEYELKMLLVKAGLIKTIQRKKARNLFSI